MAELIRWLTAANPRDRPSMREVLRSELLPPTVGDEQLTDLLRSLPDKCASNLLALHCSMLFHACFGCRSFAVRSLTLKKTGMSCSAEAYDRVVDAIFSMPVENLRPDEAPGTPNAFQVCFPHWRQPSHLLLSTAVLLLDSCNEVGWCPEVYVSGTLIGCRCQLGRECWRYWRVCLPAMGLCPWTALTLGSAQLTRLLTLLPSSPPLALGWQ